MFCSHPSSKYFLSALAMNESLPVSFLKWLRFDKCPRPLPCIGAFLFADPLFALFLLSFLKIVPQGFSPHQNLTTRVTYHYFVSRQTLQHFFLRGCQKPKAR